MLAESGGATIGMVDRIITLLKASLYKEHCITVHYWKITWSTDQSTTSSTIDRAPAFGQILSVNRRQISVLNHQGFYIYWLWLPNKELFPNLYFPHCKYLINICYTLFVSFIAVIAIYFCSYLLICFLF